VSKFATIDFLHYDKTFSNAAPPRATPPKDDTYVP
jgi:hypothetical protein